MFFHDDLTKDLNRAKKFFEDILAYTIGPFSLEDIIENNNNYSSWQLTTDNEQLTIDNVLPIEAIREGDVFGIHEVMAESNCDVIHVRHEAFSREGFATGAVIAAEFLLGKKGIFTMNDLFKI